MSESTNTQFHLLGFAIKESRFNRPSSNTPPEGIKISIDINPSAFLISEEKVFQLHLKINIKEESETFSIYIHAVGNFKFDGEINSDLLSDYFIINAPAIIFPYVRAYISSMTAMSGMQAVNLPVMNLTNLAETLRANIKEITR